VGFSVQLHLPPSALAFLAVKGYKYAILLEVNDLQGSPTSQHLLHVVTFQVM
jgi:hypothetical protein